MVHMLLATYGAWTALSKSLCPCLNQRREDQHCLTPSATVVVDSTVH